MFDFIDDFNLQCCNIVNALRASDNAFASEEIVRNLLHALENHNLPSLVDILVADKLFLLQPVNVTFDVTNACLLVKKCVDDTLVVSFKRYYLHDRASITWHKIPKGQMMEEVNETNKLLNDHVVTSELYFVIFLYYCLYNTVLECSSSGRHVPSLLSNVELLNQTAHIFASFTSAESRGWFADLCLGLYQQKVQRYLVQYPRCDVLLEVSSIVNDTARGAGLHG